MRYTWGMGNVLIAGKEFPGGAGFAVAAAQQSRNVMLTAAEAPPENRQNFQLVAWNKFSPVSTRSVIVAAGNLCGKIDEAVLFFDTALYAARYPALSVRDVMRGLDDMVAAYLFLALEILAHFSRHGQGRLVFLLKDALAAESPGPEPFPAGPSVSAGVLPGLSQAAFRAFAEGIAAKYGAGGGAQTLLVQSDAAQTDAAIAQWLFPYMDDESAWKKNALNPGAWVNYGAKPQPGISGLLQQSLRRRFLR